MNHDIDFNEDPFADDTDTAGGLQPKLDSADYETCTGCGTVNHKSDLGKRQERHAQGCPVNLARIEAFNARIQASAEANEKRRQAEREKRAAELGLTVGSALFVLIESLEHSIMRLECDLGEMADRVRELEQGR